MFLLPLPEGLDLGRGISVKFLKPQWRAHFDILIKYVTYDGCYSHIHYYHLWLLMALKGCKINMPFFLLQSLRKMAHIVQTIIGDIEQSLFHHGLLKILFQYQLNHLDRSWDEFLNANNFGLT